MTSSQSIRRALGGVLCMCALSAHAQNNAVGYIALPSRTDQKYIVANAMLAMSSGSVVHIAFQGCYNGGTGVIFGLRVMAN